MWFGASRFQLTAARRRLGADMSTTGLYWVSTHSRPKAAGRMKYGVNPQGLVSTHSRPKAAGPA